MDWVLGRKKTTMCNVQGIKKIGSDEDKDGDPETKWITCSNN